MNIAIIFAAGKGERLNSDPNSIPKQFIEIDNKPILIHTLENFQKHKLIDKIYLSISHDYMEYAKKLVQKYNVTKLKAIIEGGFCAMESIYNTLKKAQEENPSNSIVLIHDGVRPIINSDVITNNINTAKEKSNAITVIESNETIVISNNKLNPDIVPKRNTTFKAQAPQTFYLKDILDAHEKLRTINPNYENIVDNCTLYQELNYKTHLVKGNFGNIKITTKEDLYILKGILAYLKEGSDG